MDHEVGRQGVADSCRSTQPPPHGPWTIRNGERVVVLSTNVTDEKPRIVGGRIVDLERKSVHGKAVPPNAVVVKLVQVSDVDFFGEDSFGEPIGTVGAYAIVDRTKIGSSRDV